MREIWSLVVGVGGCCRGWREDWGGREDGGGGLGGFEVEDCFERGWVEPGGRLDVCAALALEEEGEPEGEGSWEGRVEWLGWALVGMEG